MGKRLGIAVIMAAMLSCAVPVLTSSPASAAVQTEGYGVPVIPPTWPLPAPTPPTVPPVQVTFGWVIYVHFSHQAIGGALLTAFVAGAGAAAGYVCTLITLGVLVPVCLAVIGFFATYFINLFNQAYHDGDGIVLEFTYVLSYFGYLIAPDSWT